MGNQTWTGADIPSTGREISCKWIFKIKHDRDKNLPAKARVVIRGYEQVHGWDFDETYAPVIRFQTLRAIILYTCMRNWKLRQYDFITAFLNADMDGSTQNIYVSTPWI